MLNYTKAIIENGYTGNHTKNTSPREKLIEQYLKALFKTYKLQELDKSNVVQFELNASLWLMYFSSKIIKTFVVLCGFAVSCFGQYGCLVDPSGSAGRSTVSRIYYNQQPGENNNPVIYYTINGFYNITCPAGATSSTRYAVNQGNTSMPSIACYVEYKNNGSPFGYPNNYYQNGRLVYFRVANCPIDDYLPFMLLGSAGLGVFVLRSRNKIALIFAVL